MAFNLLSAIHSLRKKDESIEEATVSEGTLQEQVQTSQPKPQALPAHNKFAGNIPVKQVDNKVTLYSHQNEALIKLTEAFQKQGKVKGLLVIPTGGGKTLAAVFWLLKNVINKGQKVLWLAHRHELLNQALDCAIENSRSDVLSQREYFSYRVISGLHDRLINVQKEDDLIIASKDSLTHGLNHFLKTWVYPNRNEIFVVVDEAHHAGAKSYFRLLKQLDNANDKTFRLLGLTATPFRTAKSEKALLLKVFPDDIIYGVDLRTLVSRGILADPIFRELKTPLEISRKLTEKEIKEIKTFDLPSDIAIQIAESSERNNFIVEHYLQHQEIYGQLLVFAINKIHAFTLSSLFQKRGITSDYIVSDTLDMDKMISATSTENAEKLHKFRQGELQVLVNVNILTEGTDLPSVQTVFLTRPTLSTILMTQMIGRALRGRKAGGTDVAYIVSFIDGWRDKISWVNPQRLLEDERGWVDPKDRAKQEHVARLIAINKMKEFASLMDDSINTEAIEAQPFIERVPVGLYSFAILIPDSNGEEVNKLCDILVYDNILSSYVAFISELESIFKEYRLSHFESMPEENLDDLTFYIQHSYFDDTAYRQDIKDILQFYMLNGIVPEYLQLKDRDNYDISKIIQYIWDNDLGEKTKGQYLQSIWNEEKSFWKVFFADNEKFFLRQVQLELDKLSHPNLYVKKKFVQAGVMPEIIDIRKLPLEKIQTSDLSYSRALIQGIYSKNKDEEGFYHSDISDYKSKNRLNFQIDHIQPIAQGGLTVLENLRLITRWENATEGSPRVGEIKNLNEGLKTKENIEEGDYIEDEISKITDEIRILMKEGHVEAALNRINQELAVSADKIEYHLIRTNIMITAKRPDEAFIYIDETIELFPESPEGYLVKGNLYAKQNRWDEAIDHYKKGLFKKPIHKGCLFNLGLANEKIGEYEEALRCYDNILIGHSFEDDCDNHYVAESVLRKGIVWCKINPRKKDQALEYVDRAISIDPKRVDFYTAKGELLSSWGRLEDALSSFKQALELDKDDTDALFRKGCVLGELKRYDEALKIFKHVVAKEPDTPSCYLKIAWAFDKKRNYPESVEYYQKAIALNADDAMAYNDMGHILYKMRRYEDALQAYNKALEIDPKHSCACKNKENLMKKMG